MVRKILNNDIFIYGFSLILVCLVFFFASDCIFEGFKFTIFFSPFRLFSFTLFAFLAVFGALSAFSKKDKKVNTIHLSVFFAFSINFIMQFRFGGSGSYYQYGSLLIEDGALTADGDAYRLESMLYVSVAALLCLATFITIKVIIWKFRSACVLHPEGEP